LPAYGCPARVAKGTLEGVEGENLGSGRRFFFWGGDPRLHPRGAGPQDTLLCALVVDNPSATPIFF
jgi:hypothetical protein